MKTTIFLIGLSVASFAWGTGSVSCRSNPAAEKPISFYYGVGHTLGMPLIDPEIRIHYDGNGYSIPKRQIVGYYSHDGGISILAVDEAASRVIFKMKWADDIGTLWSDLEGEGIKETPIQCTFE